MLIGSCDARIARGSKEEEEGVDFDEFAAMMLHLTGTEWSEDKLKTWFTELDSDQSGKVSLEEFFQLSLRDAQRHGGGGLGMHDIFAEFDADGSGQLSLNEFSRACQQLGYGDAAKELFAVFDSDNSGFVLYDELANVVRSGAMTPAAKSFLLAMIYRPPAAEKARAAKEGAADGSTLAAGGVLSQEMSSPGSHASALSVLRRDLRAILGSSSSRLAELFKHRRPGSDGLGAPELHRALLALGFRGSRGAIEVLFDEIDLSRALALGARRRL